MGIVREVNFRITGQVSDDYNDHDYHMLVAKLLSVCACFGVDFTDETTGRTATRIDAEEEPDD